MNLFLFAEEEKEGEEETQEAQAQEGQGTGQGKVEREEGSEPAATAKAGGEFQRELQFDDGHECVGGNTRGGTDFKKFICIFLN